MLVEAQGAGGQSVKVGGVEFVTAVAAQHAPVEAVEQDDDGVAGSAAVLVGLCFWPSHRVNGHAPYCHVTPLWALFATKTNPKPRHVGSVPTCLGFGVAGVIVWPMNDETKALRASTLAETGMDGVGPVRVVLRGLFVACAACGGRGLFHHWWKMREACPTCGLVFTRSQGYWMGAVGVNSMMSGFVLLVTIVVSFLLAMPDPSWQPILIPSVIVGFGAPLFLDPMTRTFWTSMVALGRPPGVEGHQSP